MSSLTSANLVFAANKAIIGARPALAKIGLFATDFSDEVVQPGSTIKIQLFGAGTAETFDASTANYEHNTNSVTQVSITFDKHIKCTYNFTDKDFASDKLTGSVWDRAGIAGGKDVAKGILDAVAAQINSTNCTGSVSATLGASFSKADLAKLYSACYELGIDPAETNLVLKPSYYAQMLSLFDAAVYGGVEAVRSGVVPGLYGFANVICLQPHVTGESTAATDDFNCALIPANGLVVAGRVVPVDSPSAYEEIGTQVDENTGMVLGVRRHGAAATGTNWMTIEGLFGVAVAQGAKCAIVAAS